MTAYDLICNAEALEALASRLNDANRVEECWEVRGFADRANGDECVPDEGGLYALHYVRGWNRASADSDGGLAWLDEVVA